MNFGLDNLIFEVVHQCFSVHHEWSGVGTRDLSALNRDGNYSPFVTTASKPADNPFYRLSALSR